MWVDMSNERGLPIPPGASMSVRVRPTSNGSFRKVALVYYARPGDKVDVQTTSPHHILGLSDSHEPMAVLDQLRSKAPGYHFELCERGPDGNGYQWQDFTYLREEPIVLTVLRIKATLSIPQNHLIPASDDTLREPRKDAFCRHR